MKKKSLLLLSVLALSLVGCGETTSSNSTSPKVSDTPVSDKTSDTPKESTATKPSSSMEDKTGSSSSSSVVEVKEWTADVVELMQTNLGTVLPYIDLGSKNLKPSWDSATSTLTLLGNKKGVTETQLDTAKTTYESDGWKATVKDGKMVATDSSEYITVEYFDEDGYATLTAKYAEIFNPAIANGWPKDLVTDMDFCMRNHGQDIPYVYLGSRNPTGSWYQGTYTIVGGAWNDQVLDLAKTAFDNATGWTATKNDNNTLTANVTLSDETTLTVSVYKPMGTGLATMTIECHEKFSAPATGTWSKDILEVFTNDFDGHSIPWFYTGGTPDLHSHADGDTTMTILGAPNSWNDQILSLAKAACEAENAKIADADKQWKFDESDSDELICTITYDDGSSLEFSVKNNSSRDNKAIIEVYYAPVFDAPATGSWPKEVTDVFTNDFDGHSIPWFYIGGGKTVVESHESGETTLAFYGAKYTWKDSILDLAKAACAADTKNEEEDYKWSCELDDGQLICKRKFSDGCKLKFTVENYSSSQNKAEIHVTYTEKFNPPATGSWPSSITELFRDDYDKHTIPWFYLGGTPSVVSSDEEGATIYAPEGTWDDQIVDLAKDACEKENLSITNTEEQWKCTISDGYEGKMITCSRKFSDGCAFKFTVENYLSGVDKAMMKIEFTEKFSPETDGEWSSDFTEVFTDYWDEDNEHCIPWFYIGKKTEYVDYDYESAHMTVTGDANGWNDQMLTLAKNACDTENEDIDADANKWKYTAPTTEFTASRTYEDGCTIKFTLKNENGTPTIYVYYTPAFNYPTGDDAKWSDEVQADITRLLGDGETLPFIFLGDAENYVYSTLSDGELLLEGGYWNDLIMDKAVEQLTSAASSGWTYTKNSSTRLTAKKTTSANKTITMVLSKADNDIAQIVVTLK
jgi:hypothetical protein